ncbi:alginate O-acetyltransferase AlgF [Robbsia andropogonis]|uniref:alginate O-acetyltransferase AlgF n=1 Tax=Robbsia andropogonis TaxID=28092 RepID=UPI000464FE1E|nr:alginate O-acetyltransferase AlgF [Robbsia andropogonis]MCP1118591.1 alginate O-acetyltransferase AlgF [Robbsia andropogonis]MCP1128058.1 alginate O-acetyltransferase AlgF [Robbsia andropogonis]
MTPIFSRFFLSALALTLPGLFVGSAFAADIPLYPTGPAEDSSFVRFVSGASQPVEVTASGSKARLTLDEKGPTSPFFAIAAGKPIKGTLRGDGAHQDVSATVQPGEFVSIVALDGTAKGALRVVTVREKPDDFNALKASVAFYNLDAHCTKPALKVAGRDIVLLDGVPVGQSKRRQVNPVALTVQLACGGQSVGQPLSLGTLVAGQRYTVFLVPSGTHSRVFFANDAVAH